MSRDLSLAIELLRRVLKWEACDQAEVDLQDEITAFLKDFPSAKRAAT